MIVSNTIRAIPPICILVLCLFFPAGCDRGTSINPTLIWADSLMTDNPDSAGILLQDLHSRIPGFSKEERAYYCLLQSQAEYQTGKVTSDSLIKVAVSYYEKSSDRILLAKSYLYLGKINTLLKNDSAALIYYIKAIECVPHESNEKLSADIYYSIGSIYLMQNLPDQSLQEFKKAWTYMEKAKAQSSLRFYLLRNMGRAYALQSILRKSDPADADRAISFYEKALESVTSAPQTTEIRTAYRELALLYSDKKNYDKALECLRNGSNTSDTNELYSSSGKKAWIYAKMGKLDSAYSLARKNTEDPNIYGKTTAYTLLFEIERKRGRPERALPYVDTLGILNDSIFRYIIPERIIEIQRRYNNEKLRAEKAEVEMEYEKEKSHSLKITIMVILLLISGAVYFTYVYLRQKRLQHSILEQKNELLLLKQQIQVWGRQIEMSRKRTQALQQEKQQVENNLNLIFLEKEKILNEKEDELVLLRKQEEEWLDKKNRYEALCFSEFKKQFSARSFSRKIPAFGATKVITEELSESLQRQLLSVMDETCCNFATRIYDLTQESPDKTCLCCLLKLQVKPRYIMVLCGLSKEVYSKRCQRLAENLTGQSNMQALKAYLYSF